MNAGNALRTHARDVALACALFLGAAVAVFLAAGALDARLLDWSTVDVWFEADVARVFENLTDRWSNYYRAKVHPLFSFLLFPAVFVFDRVLGFGAVTAVNIVLGLLAGTWLATFYVLLRLIGCRRPDSVLLSLVAATSASAIFWFPIPETHTLGSLTILLAMLLVAVAAHRRVPWWVDASVSALTLGVTLTNWMAGIGSTFVRRRPTRAVMVTAAGFLLVLGLWVVRKQVMPSTAFFLGNEAETGHILSPESRGPASVASSFFLHTAVMPAIDVVDRPGAGQWPIMLTQPAAPGSAGPLGFISVGLWIALLALGLVALVTLRGYGRLRLFLAGVIAGQFALHIAFGNETFLYAPNFLPLLLGLVALGLLTPMRPAVLGLASLLLVTNTLNNVGQRMRADVFFDEYEYMRHDVRQAAVLPPAELLAEEPSRPLKVSVPGARSFDQGSYGQAGSFSPGIDQFNVSFWVTDTAGNLVEGRALSGPIADWPVMRGDTVVGMYTETPAYLASWKAAGPRRWELTVWVRPADLKVALTVRSVGTEDGPVRSLAWDGEQLFVNDRWIITAAAPVATAWLVDETEPDWMTDTREGSRIEVEDGWAAARIELPGPGRYDFTVMDVDPDAPIDREIARITSRGVMVDMRAADPERASDSANGTPGGAGASREPVGGV